MVRAKFRVTELLRRQHWDRTQHAELVTIRLAPVTGDSEENKKFFSATPAGDISLATVRQEVAEAFELGQEYYVDFSPANAH